MSLQPTSAITSFTTPSIMALASPAFCAFCLVMDDISSREEEVSSIDAACSEAPSGSLWLDWDTCSEPAATALDEVVRSLFAFFKGLVTPLIGIPEALKGFRPNVGDQHGALGHQKLLKVPVRFQDMINAGEPADVSPNE
jgi:hypothetical protein